MTLFDRLKPRPGNLRLWQVGLLAGIFIVYVVIRCGLNPRLGPPLAKA